MPEVGTHSSRTTTRPDTSVNIEGATVPDSGATSGTATVPYGAYVADQSAGHSWDVAANYNQDATFLVVNPLKP